MLFTFITQRQISVMNKSVVYIWKLSPYWKVWDTYVNNLSTGTKLSLRTETFVLSVLYFGHFTQFLSHLSVLSNFCPFIPIFGRFDHSVLFWPNLSVLSYCLSVLSYFCPFRPIFCPFWPIFVRIVLFFRVRFFPNKADRDTPAVLVHIL